MMEVWVKELWMLIKMKLEINKISSRIFENSFEFKF